MMTWPRMANTAEVAAMAVKHAQKSMRRVVAVMPWGMSVSTAVFMTGS